MAKWLMVSAVAALGTTSAADAAVVLNVQLAANPAPISNTGTQSGYTAYIVSIVSDQGVITACDFANGGGGIFGSLSQRWVDTDEDITGFEPSPRGTVIGTGTTSAVNHDSHWFANTTLDANAASENNNVSQQPAPFSDTVMADYGVGSEMKYAFALAPDSQSTNVTLAYLVVRNNRPLAISGLITTLGNPVPVAVAFGAGLSLPLPEPTSLALVGFGAFGLLSRRRRQA